MGKNKVFFPAIFPAIAADGLAMIGLLALYPALFVRFSEPNGVNALILSVGFIVFCVGVFALRRFQPFEEGGDELLSRRLRILLAIIFALTMSLAIAWQLGFFESGPIVDTRDLGEGGAAVYFVFAPGAWLGFAFIYVLVLAFSVTPRTAPGLHSRPIIGFLCLLATDAMLLLLVAQANAIFGGYSIIWLPLLLAWLAVLFVPPRLTYLARVTERSTIDFRIVIGVLVGLIAVSAYKALAGI